MDVEGDEKPRHHGLLLASGLCNMAGAKSTAPSYLGKLTFDRPIDPLMDGYLRSTVASVLPMDDSSSKILPVSQREEADARDTERFSLSPPLSAVASLIDTLPFEGKGRGPGGDGDVLLGTPERLTFY